MKKLLRKIKNRFKKDSTINTHKVKLAGHSFKVLDPAKMTKIRQTHFFLSEHEREWGMTKQDLLAYDDVILKEMTIDKEWETSADLANILQDKFRKIHALVDTRRLLIQEDFQYKPFLKAAAIIILMDDEDPNTIDHDLIQKKLDLCRNNEEIAAFFLRVIRAFQVSITSTLDTSKMWEWYPNPHLLITEKKVLTEVNQTIYSTGSE